MKIGQRFKRAGESYEFLRMLPSGTIEARRISTGEICRMLSAAQIKRKKQQEQELKNRQEQAALKRDRELAKVRMAELRLREESDQLIDRTPALRQLREEYRLKSQKQEHHQEEDV